MCIIYVNALFVMYMCVYSTCVFNMYKITRMGYNWLLIRLSFLFLIICSNFISVIFIINIIYYNCYYIIYIIFLLFLAITLYSNSLLLFANHEDCHMHAWRFLVCATGLSSTTYVRTHTHICIVHGIWMSDCMHGYLMWCQQRTAWANDCLLHVARLKNQIDAEPRLYRPLNIFFHGLRFTLL